MHKRLLCIVLGLSILSSGCFSIRNRMPLDKTYHPAKSTAIIPLQTSNYTGLNNENLSSEKVIRLVNTVLDTLSKLTDDQIIGPSELQSILGTKSSIKSINNCLTMPKSPDCQLDPLISFLCEAEIENIVQIKVNLSEHYYKYSDTASSGGFFGIRKKGQVNLTANLFKLQNENYEIINTSNKSSEYGSNKGWMVGGGMGAVFAFPYIYGKSLGRAVDQSARQALSQLFNSPRMGIVVDEKNHLEWIIGPNWDTNWYEAKEWIDSLQIDNGDWRMPTRKELKYLYDVRNEIKNFDGLELINNWWVWTSETNISWAYIFIFDDVRYYDRSELNISYYHRAIAVRSRD